MACIVGKNMSGKLSFFYRNSYTALVLFSYCANPKLF